MLATLLDVNVTCHKQISSLKLSTGDRYLLVRVNWNFVIVYIFNVYEFSEYFFFIYAYNYILVYLTNFNVNRTYFVNRINTKQC